jgi:hypothetical protein
MRRFSILIVVGLAPFGCSSGDIGDGTAVQDSGDDSGVTLDTSSGGDVHVDAPSDADAKSDTSIADAKGDTTSSGDTKTSGDSIATDSTVADSTTTIDTSVVDTSVTDTLVVDTTPIDTSVSDTKPADTGTTIDTGGGTDTGTTASSPVIAGCTIFPSDNPWNTRIDGYPLSAHSSDYLATMSTATHLHADWGTFTEEYGIPWDSGTGAAPKHMNWSVSYGFTESDTLACTDGSGYAFCYPIPFTVHIEGGTGASTGSDRHVNWLDTGGAPDHCILYEIYNAQNPPDATGNWKAQNGAIFHLDSNALRPDGWTSADAAGLSVFAGLVKYDEVVAGEIRHAIRFTMNNTSNDHIHPATHEASSLALYYPPMGLRLRLKSSVSIASYTTQAQVILLAMQRYGIIVADNGSDWYISGDTNDGWAAIAGGIGTAFNAIHGSDFEVVETGTPMP